MQRQSLGSPSSKLIVKKNELQINTTLISSSSSSSEDKQEQLIINKLKPKSAYSTSTYNKPETYIHLIPMLTLFCFLILYLSSHNPSQFDMDEFNGLKSFTNPRDLEDKNVLELDIKKGDILKGIRSLKADITKHRRVHRKIPNF